MLLPSNTTQNSSEKSKERCGACTGCFVCYGH